MSWEEQFRELAIEKEQWKKAEKRAAEEEKRKQRERNEMVRKFRNRVEKVIGKFNKASGCNLRESEYEECERGTWDYDDFTVRIGPVAIIVWYNQMGKSGIGKYFEDIPLSTFTEEALAKALVKAYKSRGD